MSTDTDTVEEMQEVTAPMDAAMESVENSEQTQEIVDVQEEQKEEQVPLSALQKERKKRQDWEQRAKLYEEERAQSLRSQSQQPVDEEDEYEAVTKADYKKGKQEIIRDVTESLWAKENPEKVAEVNEKLIELIKQRPHLKLAIEAAPNRYEEAYTLMNALSPKQKQALKVPAAVKKSAPGSPNSVPKAAGINQTVDVMTMTDSEFTAWRKAQRKGR